MIPAAFDYARPKTLQEAVDLLERHADEAKVLAGGHSLIPAMKLRLAQPKVVIDLGRIADLSYIRADGDRLAIGALTTHYDLESSPVVRSECPLLAEVAARIGDVQVRNKGTIGGSLAHADPAADWPAAVLALDAELEIVGRQGPRRVKAADFFVDMFQTAIGPGEILRQIRVPRTDASVAYVKTPQKASGFALAAVAVVIDRTAQAARVGVTGVAPTPYRARRTEQALTARPLSVRLIELAAAEAAAGVEPLTDLHASAEYRAHLARTNTARALTAAMGR